MTRRATPEACQYILRNVSPYFTYLPKFILILIPYVVLTFNNSYVLLLFCACIMVRFRVTFGSAMKDNTNQINNKTESQPFRDLRAQLEQCPQSFQLRKEGFPTFTPKCSMNIKLNQQAQVRIRQLLKATLARCPIKPLWWCVPTTQHSSKSIAGSWVGYVQTLEESWHEAG